MATEIVPPISNVPISFPFIAMAEEDTAKKEDDQPLVGDAADDKTDSGDSSTDDAGDDTSGEEKLEKETRSTKRIKKLAADKQKLLDRQEDLEEQVKTLTKLAAEKRKSGEEEEEGDGSDLEDMGFNESQIKQLKRVVSKASNLPEMQKQIQELQKDLKASRDSQAQTEDDRDKAEALKKYKEVIDEEGLQEILEELRDHTNPRMRVLAQAPYDVIIRHAKADKIAEMDLDKTLESKKKGAPKVKGGTGGKTEPEKKREPLPAGNMAAATDMLLERVLTSMAAEE